jgi:two-component system NarL family sensor kinase
LDQGDTINQNTFSDRLNFIRKVKNFCDFREMKYYLTLFLGLLFFSSSGQNKKLDSLKNLLDKTPGDTRKMTLYNELSRASQTVDFLKSLEYATRAKELAKKNSNNSELARALLNAGISYYYQGKYGEALDQFLHSLTLFESLNDKPGTIAVLNEMGTLEKKNGDLKNSEIHLLKALELSREIGDSSSLANSMNNIGHLYEVQDDLKKAMDFYSGSAAIKEARGDLYGASFSYDNMANILSKEGKFAEAQTFFEKEIGILKNLNDRAAYAIALNNMGEMLDMKGDIGKAREYFLSSLAVSNTIGYKDLESHILNMLSESYKKQNNYKKSYEYLVQRNQVKDSIFNEQKSKQLLDLRTKYETEKKESEILFLKQENEIQDFSLRQNRLFNLGLIVVVLALVIVGYLWRNRTMLKQKAELEATRASLRESQLHAVITSQESERKRFAADLHDGLGQIISAVRLSLSKENPEKNTVDHALSLLNDMNVEIRNIAFNLMPRSLTEDGLQEALEEFANRINRSGNVQISVKAYHLSSQIDIEQKVALYRVCQEWVNNVLKYGNSARVSIQIVQHHDELVLTIEDDGNGFDTTKLTQGAGNGWKNINSRIGLLKGALEIDSRPGRQGTTVLITIPSFTFVAELRTGT